MKINKKFVSSLLGGGVISGGFSFGAIKLNNNIAYNKKLTRYEKISKDFSKYDLNSDSEGSWYLPKYQDNEAWKTTYRSKSSNRDEGSKFVKNYPSWENFRDSCYKSAEKSESCTWTTGWCIECARKTLWTLEKERAKR